MPLLLVQTAYREARGTSRSGQLTNFGRVHPSKFKDTTFKSKGCIIWTPTGNITSGLGVFVFKWGFGIEMAGFYGR